MTASHERPLGVLVIEDNTGDARLIRELLIDSGHVSSFRLTRVASLSDGLAQLATTPIDVVLLDLSLPDSQGLETCIRLLAQAPWVPVVVLSGTDDEHLAIAAVKKGAQDYLVKGRVEGDLLVRAMRYAIERKAAEGERQWLLRREREARSRAERLAAEHAAILTSAADGVITAGSDGVITYANPAALRLHGVETLTSPRIGPDVPYQLLTADGQPYQHGNLPLIRAALLGETITAADLRIRRPDGSEVAVSASATPLRSDDGELLGAVLTLHDVTAQRELERQKDEFFANVSHDLRTPLAAIKASIGAVLANEPAATPAPIHHLLVNIDQATDRMARLVDDLLELTRLQAGRVRLRRSRCDLREVAERCARDVETLTSKRDQRLEVAVPRAPVWALVDAERLERALLNLLSNAYRYGRDGGMIRLSLGERAGDAIFAVIDDGPGIAHEDRERIFERFYRASAEAAQRQIGSGLGLPIARSLVEMHGGHVWVESEAGKGSAFFLTVPLASQGMADVEERR